jgi:hypothetical protein
MGSPPSYFSNLTDPRVERTCEHDPEEILFIATVLIICGTESWYDDMEEFGKSKEEWLKIFLRLQGWIPSHDTFNHVFSVLYPVDLENSFISWTQAAARLSEGEVAAIDGRSMHGTGENDNKGIVHIVSAWVQENHTGPGQVEVDGLPKGNSYTNHRERSALHSVLAEEPR